MEKVNNRSLFIGRWQPFHKGHKLLIEKTLREGNNVVIAVRDTEINKDNPYSYKARCKMIMEQMSDWEDRLEIIKIPDIDEVCHGRKVGWKIREIKLDKKTEQISGTSIRKKMI